MPAPANVRATNGPNAGEVVVAWGAVNDAAYYRIGWIAIEDYNAIVAAGGDWLEGFTFIDVANRGQTEYTVTHLTPGLRYAFIVASNSERYGSPQWSEWAFLTLNADGAACPTTGDPPPPPTQQQDTTATPTPEANATTTPEPTPTPTTTPATAPKHPPRLAEV